MGKKKKPRIVISEGDEEKKIEVTSVKGKGAGMEVVKSDFEPRLKNPGDLILAEEWNDIQEEIKDDLMNVVHAIETVNKKSSVMISSGIGSHGIFIELNWDVRPHVILSLSGTISEADKNVNMISYPHDISSKGFRIVSRSQDGGVEGIVNWVAIGVS